LSFLEFFDDKAKNYVEYLAETGYFKMLLILGGSNLLILNS